MSTHYPNSVSPVRPFTHKAIRDRKVSHFSKQYRQQYQYFFNLSNKIQNEAFKSLSPNKLRIFVSSFLLFFMTHTESEVRTPKVYTFMRVSAIRREVDESGNVDTTRKSVTARGDIPMVITIFSRAVHTCRPMSRSSGHVSCASTVPPFNKTRVDEVLATESSKVYIKIR